MVIHMNHDMAKKFLGVGWKFPIEVDAVTGRIKTSSYEEDIQEAIRIILMTNKGERAMMPDFGCSLGEYVFEHMDYSNIVKLQEEIRLALIIWEPRIESVEVTVEMDTEENSRLNILVSYVVRATNNPYNLVFPYHLYEGLE